MAVKLSQDTDNSGRLEFGEKTFLQKFTPGVNNKFRLAQIDQQAAELENSPYNLASLTKENQDYYATTAAETARSIAESRYGLSNEQKAEARQNFSENTNLGVQNAQNAAGGNLQQYINANTNTNVNKFATGLAAEDQAVKMQKQQQVLQYLNQLGNAAGNTQDVQNMNFQKNILAEQAIGAAKTDWYAQRDQRRRDLLNAGTNLVGTAVSLGIARNS